MVFSKPMLIIAATAMVMSAVSVHSNNTSNDISLQQQHENSDDIVVITNTTLSPIQLRRRKQNIDHEKIQDLEIGMSEETNNGTFSSDKIVDRGATRAAYNRSRNYDEKEDDQNSHHETPHIRITNTLTNNEESKGGGTVENEGLSAEEKEENQNISTSLHQFDTDHVVTTETTAVIATKKKERRKYQLRRRRDQSICRGFCRSQIDCRNSAAANFLCSGYVNCVYGQCSNVDTRFSVRRCGIQCFSSANCRNAFDSCDSCIGGRCQIGNKCGTPCRTNPSICNGATDGCNRCGNGGTCTSNLQPTCGTACNDDSNCSNALSGCNECVAGVCAVGNRNVVVGTPVRASCVNTAATLEAALNIGGNVAICGATTIPIRQEIIVTRDNINLTCLNAPCVLEGNNRTRLLRINGRNIRITGITFRNGFAIGNGGALLITGGDNLIIDCNFYGNRATQRGGAAMVYSATYRNNDANGNFAAQCTRIYQRATRSCVRI